MDTASEKAAEKALRLAEILACIGRFLQKKDILECVRVCKAWKTEFEPALWRSFVLSKPARLSKQSTASEDPEEFFEPTIEMPVRESPPALALMQRNAQHIRRLTITDFRQAVMPFLAQCTHLEQLVLSVGALSRSLAMEEAMWRQFSNMLRDHPRIRKIVLENVPEQGMFMSFNIPASFFETLRTCPKLVVIETLECFFSGSAAQAYLATCQNHIRRISCHRDSFDSDFKFPQDFVFKELRYLDLRDLMNLSCDKMFDWIIRCPNLISLNWEMGLATIPIKKFCQVVPMACPNLTELHLLIPLHDDMIAQILDAIPRIEKLSLARTMFGELAFAALRRHFPKLRDINLQASSKATSSMLQEIMASCPNLQSISGEVLNYSDIVKQPWVCRNLQMFDIGIIVGNENLDTDRDQYADRSCDPDKEVYARLAQLIKLEYLSIVNYIVEESYYSSDNYPIMLSMKAGFDQLETLNNLTFFSCKFLFERTLEDGEGESVVHWMIAHWKRLETLEAVGLHEVAEYSGDEMHEVWCNLQENGIKYIDYMYSESFDEDDYGSHFDPDEEDEMLGFSDQYYDDLDDLDDLGDLGDLDDL